MSRTVSQLNVSLSRLVTGRRNPRRVKPAREAHHRLVALIRSQGLLQPLVVRPMEDKPHHYLVIAGHRRLSALREIHQGHGDPKIPCVLRDVDTDTADALSLGENFGQQPMHPLDEAEAFAKLAAQDGKEVETIAADFGVREQYVRQRMKLASLASVIKTAYRGDEIDTATAEVFTSLPEERQNEVWIELNGHPRHAEHVRNIIANDWIDAVHALFDVSTLPEGSVSRDLFSERVLIERQAFMAAQVDAIGTQRLALLEDGWKDVTAGRYEDVHQLPFAMDPPEPEYDDATTARLDKLARRRQAWEAKLEKVDDADESALGRIQDKLDALENEEQEIMRNAPVHYSEATKSLGTAFLILYPDGQVKREYRVPRSRRGTINGNRSSDTNGNGAVDDRLKPKTSEDLAERQLAATFTHQALSVREALLKDDKARKRVLVMILHDKFRSEALAVRHEPNGTTLHASQGETFASAAFDRLSKQRSKLDPFADDHYVEDHSGYARLSELSPSKLDALTDLLIVDCLTAHLQRETELVTLLAGELGVNVRDYWRPDSAWLEGYQKIQLAHLMAELRGPVYDPARETRKKSELVEALAKLFADAAEGKLEDKPLAERANRWLPANLRPTDTPAA